jgi:hypothetical protein
MSQPARTPEATGEQDQQAAVERGERRPPGCPLQHEQLLPQERVL